MSGFLGCISKKKIDRKFFEDCVLKIQKGFPEKYYLYNFNKKIYYVSLAESHFKNEGLNLKVDSNCVFTVSNGVVYSSDLLSGVKNTALNPYLCSKNITDLYIKYGNRVVDYVEGKYSCAIYDMNSEQITLIRDSFGSKSLYYYLDQDLFIFSSDINPIVHFLKRFGNLSIDNQSVIKYFCLLFVPPPATFFKQIKKLDAANMLVFNTNSWSIRRNTYYWDLNNIALNTKLNEREIISETDRLLNNSVKNYLNVLDKHKTTVFLGGLDSTSLAIYLSRNVKKVSSFTIKFTGMEGVRDAPYAIKSAKKLGIKHTQLDFDKDNVLETFEEVMRYLSGPSCLWGTIPFYYLAKNIRTETPCAFSGNAAEMLFNTSHDPTYNQIKQLERLIKVYNLISFSLRKKESFYDLLRFPYTGNFTSKFLLFGRYSLSEQLYKVLKNKTVDHCQNVFLNTERILNKFNQNDIQNKILYFNYHHEVTNFFAPENDAITSAAGVESISPFLDRKLAEFMFSVEGRWKINKTANKYILRKIMAKHLGNDIAFRKSNTIAEYPYNNWIKNELREMFENYLFIDNEFINTKFVKQIYSDHLENKADYSMLLHQIFQFQYYINNYRKL